MKCLFLFIGTAKSKQFAKNIAASHMMKFCQEPGTFSCHHCPFKTKLVQNILIHEKHHFGNDPYKCTFCTYSSKNDKTLLYHVRLVHSKVKKNSSYHVGAMLVINQF